MSDRKELARQVYEAFSAGDRDLFEEHLAEELTFRRRRLLSLV
jgi:ketosteroid isomerase-like protein